LCFALFKKPNAKAFEEEDQVSDEISLERD